MSTCTNTPGGRTCGACPAGYDGTGTTGCTDINECLTANGGCDPLTTCMNTPGSRTCGACPAGYAGSGATSCTDIDECLTANGGCDPVSTCTNTPGGRTCGACPAGYAGTGSTGCIDIDECLTANGGCDPLTACTNTAGSRTCGACPAGYSGTGVTACTDINECLTANGGCDPLTTCTNTPGSRTCGACPAGYAGTGAPGCTDIDECLTANGGCDPVSTCTNTAGGRTCGACPAGYSGSGATGCTDLDECLTANGGCDALTTCTNTPGSRTCGACPAGYAGSGATSCTDIDECLTANGGCDPLTACTNTAGSRTCGACPAGYVGSGATGCTDIDECLTAHGGCDPLATCTNTPGSRTCGACPAGYAGSGATSCTDIDECLTANGGCDQLTTCTNTAGSRTCSACPAGYAGTGATGCTDINECLTANGGCDPLSTCTNTPGSRTCGACPAGYSGSGATSCTDINECLTANGGCDPLTSCTNAPGSRICGACPSGYSGTGADGCKDIDECLTNNGGCGNTSTTRCFNQIGAPPICCVDEDHDGYGQCSLMQPDCDDKNAQHWSDCGRCTDEDHDGYGQGCDLGADCDDARKAVHPNAVEVPGDGLDNDCDGASADDLIYVANLAGGSARAVTYLGTRVVAAIGYTVAFFDSDTVSAGPSQTFVFPDVVSSLAVSQNILYAGINQVGFARFDVSNPAVPVFLDTFRYLPNGSTELPRYPAISFSGGLAAVCDALPRMVNLGLFDAQAAGLHRRGSWAGFGTSLWPSQDHCDAAILPNAQVAVAATPSGSVILKYGEGGLNYSTFSTSEYLVWPMTSVGDTLYARYYDRWYGFTGIYSETYSGNTSWGGSYWNADQVTGTMKAQGGLLSFSAKSGTTSCLKAIGVPVAGAPSPSCAPLPDPLEDMDRSGNRLLVAHARGLNRYQVNAARVFTSDDGYPSMGGMSDMVVQPPYVYLVDAKSGFEIWHLDEMTGSVTRLGRLASATGVRLAVSGNRAYLAAPASPSGLMVIAVDVTVPSGPIELGRYTSGPATWWDVWGVEQRNDYVYVLGRYGPVQVIDTRNPKAMTTAGIFYPGVYDQSIAVWGDRLVVAGNEYPPNPYLKLCDLTASPTSPPCSDRIALTRGPSALTISGDLAIAVEGGSGTSIIDLPTRTVIWSGPSPAGTAVTVRDDTAYVLGGKGDVHMVSLVNPYQPTVVTKVGGGHLPGRVGSAAVRATPSSLLVLDPATGVTVYRRPSPASTPLTGP